MVSRELGRWLVAAGAVFLSGSFVYLMLTMPVSSHSQAYPPGATPTPPAYPPPGAPAGPTPPGQPAVNLGPAAYFPLIVWEWGRPSPKKGLAWTYSDLYPTEHTRVNVSWFHNWGVTSVVEADSWLAFVPFVRCATEGEISAAVTHLGAGYDGYVLFLNEPDHDNLAQGCGVTPQEAAQRYVTLRSALPAAKLIGPNPRWREDPETFVALWRDEVHTLTGSYPDVTGYGLHFYTTIVGDVHTIINNFCAAMNNWSEGDKELWITEFGVDQQLLEETRVKDILFQLLDVFERHVGLEAGCEIDRYAYYTTRQRREIFGPGTPTPTVAPPTPAFAIGQYTDLYCHYSTTPTWTGEAYRAYGLITPSPTPSPVPGFTPVPTTIYHHCPPEPPPPTATPLPSPTATPLPPGGCLDAGQPCPTPSGG